MIMDMDMDADIDFDADAVLASYSSYDTANHKSVLFVYFIFILFALMVIAFIFIKLKYPFWNALPVYHPYDFWRTWKKKPFLIQPVGKLPRKTKFCDFQQVISFEYGDFDSDSDSYKIKKSEVLNLLQSHYLEDPDSLFMFHYENLDAYHTGNSFASQVSVYLDDSKIMGCIFSRAISVHFTHDSSTMNSDWVHPMQCFSDLGFLDLACSPLSIDISRKLLETHCYRLLLKNSVKELVSKLSLSEIKSSDSNHAFIFRKEGEPYSGICPFLTFQTRLFAIPNATKLNAMIVSNVLPFSFRMVFIQSSNMYLFTDLLDEIVGLSTFSIVGISSVGNLESLIKKRVLFVACVLGSGPSNKKDSDIFCLYVFRDSRISMENYRDGSSGSVLNLIASFQHSNSSTLFFRGFLHALRDIITAVPAFRLLGMEEISHNGLLLEDFMDAFNTNELTKSDVNYYAYNAVFPTGNSSQVFFVF
jgi:hypothetical protein